MDYGPICGLVLPRTTSPPPKLELDGRKRKLIDIISCSSSRDIWYSSTRQSLACRAWHAPIIFRRASNGLVRKQRALRGAPRQLANSINHWAWSSARPIDLVSAPAIWTCINIVGRRGRGDLQAVVRLGALTTPSRPIPINRRAPIITR